MIVSLVVLSPTCLRGEEPTAGEVKRVKDTGDFANQPELLWKVSPLPHLSDVFGDASHSFGGLLFQSGRVITTDELGWIYAIDGKTGKIEWAYLDEGGERSQAPAVDDDTLYFANAKGIIAMSLTEGRIRWRYAIEHGASESAPVVLGNRLFVAAYDGFTYALSINDGGLLWKKDIVTGATSSERARLGDKPARPRPPVTDGRTLFLPVFDQSRLIAIDLDTGEFKWTLETDGWIYARPAITERYVLIGSQDRTFYCCEKDTGEIVWTDKVSSRIEAGTTVHEGSVYYGSCAGEVIRADLETGERRWTFQCDFSANMRSPIYCAPLVVDSVVYQANMEGQVYAIDIESGELRWKVRPLPKSEIVNGLATDGERFFLTTRPHDGEGENAVIAIGFEGVTP